MENKICDICKKDVSSNIPRRWFELRKIYKEMDYGMEMDEMELHICSKKCLIELAKNMKELSDKIPWYDR